MLWAQIIPDSTLLKWENDEQWQALEYTFSKGEKSRSKNHSSHRQLQSSQPTILNHWNSYLSDSSYPCRLPSHADWLGQKSGIPHASCTPQTQINILENGFPSVRDLDPNRIYRIDLLVASPGSGLAGNFGHTMLRLEFCAPDLKQGDSSVIAGTTFGPKCSEDLLYHVVLGFRADLYDAQMSYIKGISGVYPLKLFALTMDDIMQDYLQGQGRNLWSYPLQLDSIQKKKFIHRVLEVLWNYEGRYRFFSQNCASGLQDFFLSLDLDTVTRRFLSENRTILPVRIPIIFKHAGLLSNEKPEFFPAITPDLIRTWQILHNSKIKPDPDILQLELKIDDPSDRWNRLIAKLDQSSFEKMSKSNEMIFAAQFYEDQAFRKQSALLRSEVSKQMRDQEDLKVKFRNLIDLGRLGWNRKQGYGIPIQNELISMDSLHNSQLTFYQKWQEAQSQILEAFPKAKKTLEQIDFYQRKYDSLGKKWRAQFRPLLRKRVDSIWRERVKSDPNFSHKLLEIAHSDQMDLIESVRIEWPVEWRSPILLGPTSIRCLAQKNLSLVQDSICLTLN